MVPRSIPFLSKGGRYRLAARTRHLVARPGARRCIRNDVHRARAAPHAFLGTLSKGAACVAMVFASQSNASPARCRPLTDSSSDAPDSFCSARPSGAAQLLSPPEVGSLAPRRPSFCAPAVSNPVSSGGFHVGAIKRDALARHWRVALCLAYGASDPGGRSGGGRTPARTFLDCVAASSRGFVVAMARSQNALIAHTVGFTDKTIVIVWLPQDTAGVLATDHRTAWMATPTVAAKVHPHTGLPMNSDDPWNSCARSEVACGDQRQPRTVLSTARPVAMPDRWITFVYLGD
ncbi:hypothetical protein MRX96_030721 [Rhipicephalus microplus]